MRRVSLLCVFLLGALGCGDGDAGRPPLQTIVVPGQEPLAAIVAESPESPWNIVLISIDTLRADRVSTYG